MRDYEGMTDDKIEQEVLIIRSDLEPPAKNFLSSWAMTGRIMQENRISLIWDEELLTWVAKGTAEHPDHGELAEVSDWGANPLRCICIVFLMMQDAIKELEV